MMILALNDSLQFLVPLAVALAKIVAVVFMFVLPCVAYSVYAERRVSALIQDRLGPNRVGPFGLFQPVADGLKFLFKESIIPAHVNKLYFLIAPPLAMFPALMTVAAIPFGSTINVNYTLILGAYEFVITPVKMVIADINVGLLYIFAMSSLSVYGIVLAGWSSNSKYPFLGGIRASAQLISYEISMGLAIMPVVMITGTLNLSEIVVWQSHNGWLVFPAISSHVSWEWLGVLQQHGPLALLAHWKQTGFLSQLLLWIPFLISFLIFLVSAFAETNRLPFDMPECETELVGGYHTEYSSMRFALFFLGEYAAMIVMSSLMVTLFFGGWAFPFLPAVAGDRGLVDSLLLAVLHVASFSVKMILFMLFFIWIRWCLPRFRYDQLMSLGWKVFLPLSLANLIFTAIVLNVLRN